MTTEQAIHQMELVTEFLHDDRQDDQGPYGPGVTARATAAANAVLAVGPSCTLCAGYGREHDCPCNTP